MVDLVFGLMLGLACFAGGCLIAARVAARHDRTERRRVERMEDHLIATVSHELRTPLTSINASLRLLGAGVLADEPEHARNLLRIASANADRLARVIDDMITIERLDSGRVLLDFKAWSPLEIAQAATDSLLEKDGHSRIRLQVASSVDATKLVHADGERLQQVVRNLVENALKFSPPESTVSLSIDATARHARFSVSDQGIGIPADQLDMIFHRFRQLDTSDSRRTGGTGLGLAICKSIVEAHGGRIRAESRGPGTGSTFSFCVPRSVGPSHPVECGCNVGGKAQRIEGFGQDAGSAELPEFSAVE